MTNVNHGQDCLQVPPACRMPGNELVELAPSASALRASRHSEVSGDLAFHTHSHCTMREMLRSRGPP